MTDLIEEARSYLSPKNGAYVQVPSADMFAAVVDALETAAIQMKRLEKVTHSEDTLFKVYEALEEQGLDAAQSTIAVSTMQNRGILFRERVES